MSKRTVQQQDESHLPSKKQQTFDIRTAVSSISQKNISQAINTISSNAEDLIACLQSLRRATSVQNAPTENAADLSKIRDELQTLARKLAPDFQVLSSQEVNSTEPSTVNIEMNAPVLRPSQVRAWVASDIPGTLPQIPQILDSKLEKVVFTHPGVAEGSSYERLEWLGDAYVELISSILISKTFGHLPSGRWTQLRERLVRNVTLAEYFREYRLESKARLPDSIVRDVSQGRGKSNDKDIIKTQADMFEAYIAAAILSDPENGLNNTVNWLRDIWSRTLEKEIRQTERQQPSEETSKRHFQEPKAAKKEHPKQELSNRIVVPGIHLTYEKNECTKKDKNLGLPLFAVGLYLDGWGEKHKLLGVGTALSVKEAGAKAAQETLNNKKVMSGLEAKKKAYMEARQASGVVENS